VQTVHDVSIVLQDIRPCGMYIFYTVQSKNILILVEKWNFL